MLHLINLTTISVPGKMWGWEVPRYRWSLVRRELLLPPRGLSPSVGRWDPSILVLSPCWTTFEHPPIRTHNKTDGQTIFTCQVNIKGPMSWPFLLIIIPLLRYTKIDLYCAIFQTLIQHLCIVCVFTSDVRWGSWLVRHWLFQSQIYKYYSLFWP